MTIREVDTAALVRLATGKGASKAEAEELLRRVEMLYDTCGGDPFNYKSPGAYQYKTKEEKVKHFEEILQSVVAEAADDQLHKLIDEASTELSARTRKRFEGTDPRTARQALKDLETDEAKYAKMHESTSFAAASAMEDVRNTFAKDPFGIKENLRGMGPTEYVPGWTKPVTGDDIVKLDDRHIFASGAMSSGKKPPYAQTMPQFAYERFARHRGYGDAKYGENNYLKGCKDKEFILDRINHGIEHLLKLAGQIQAGYPGYKKAGEDDAAAVMCAGMFVMCYQEENDPLLEVPDGPKQR